MAGALAHSPADVLRRWLIGAGLGLDPPSEPWPIFVGAEPAAPDNCVTVYDTLGRAGGFNMTDGERRESHGFQVRVRAAAYPTGYAKARAVAVALDKDTNFDTVAVGGINYLVHTVARTTDVIPLGQDQTSRRVLFTVNGLIFVRTKS